MKARRYITQFYKILPAKAVDQKYIHKKSSKKIHEFESSKPNLRKHDEHYLESVIWTGTYGKVVLYPVRLIYTYVLSINGRSKLYPKADGIYKALVGKGVIPTVQSLANSFKNYQMLDLETIAVLSNYGCSKAGISSRADFSSLPAYDWIINMEDAHLESFGRSSSISYIPCLHEYKVVVELFLETNSITEEQAAKLKKERFKVFESSFSLSSEAIQEILDDIGVYF